MMFWLGVNHYYIEQLEVNCFAAKNENKKCFEYAYVQYNVTGYKLFRLSSYFHLCSGFLRLVTGLDG